MNSTVTPARSELHILLVTSIFAPTIGGAGAVAQALAESLPANVVVAAPAIPASSPAGDTAPRFGFSLYRVPSFQHKASASLPSRLRGPWQLLCDLFAVRPRALRSLQQQLKHRPVDVLCINTLGSCYWLPSHFKQLYPGVKVVFYLHAEELNVGDRLYRNDLLAQAALRQADAVITVSSYTRDRALHCGVSPQKITVINNGVDTTRFFPGPPDPVLQQRFHLDGRKVLLCLARLDQRKGQDKLIEAMPHILAAVPNAVLLIVGEGEGNEEQRLRNLAASLQLGPAVIFAGFATDDEVVRYYRTADVYVMPNRTTADGDTEGFGLVFLEAGACARPVIGGRDGGVPDAIINGHTGLLVDGNSVPAIATACISVLNDPQLAASLAANGLTHSAGALWSVQAQKFLQVCEDLCTQPAEIVIQEATAAS